MAQFTWKKTITVTLASLLTFVQSAVHLEQPEHVCVSGCNIWAGLVVWNVTVDASPEDEDYYYVSSCSNNIRLQSVYWCAQAYCTAGDIYAGLDFFNITCVEEVGLPLPRFEELATSQGNLAQAPRIALADYAFESLNETSLPDDDWAALSRRTARAYDQNFWLIYDFTWASYGFWGLVFVISFANRLVEQIKVYRARPAIQRMHSRGVSTWIRRQLVIPASFGKHCQEPIGWATLPPRLEAIIIFGYILMSCIMCFPGYDLFDNNQYWTDIGAQLARYIADRTAVLSIANVPLLWLFAARNDPLLWLTGFSYASFNRFHRWVARLAYVFALIHSIVWTYDYLYFYGKEEYYAAYQEVWWCSGVVATTIMSILLPASVYWLRQKHYDFFLIVHILLSLIFLVTLYFHIQVYEHFFDGFIWPCVAMWSLDRLIRIVRVVYISVIPRFTKNAKAIATYDTRSEIVRLDVTGYFSKTTGIAPGLYYYAYLPASVKGWESHPFTLCSWNQALSVPASPATPAGSIDLESTEKKPSATIQIFRPSETSATNHSLLIRPHAGFTQRLRTKILASNETEGSCEVTVLLEGPYGRKLDLSRYSDVLIIAAGSGIVTAVSHAHYLLANEYTEVHISWIVPQRHLVEDLCEHEFAAVLGNLRFHLTVYVTGNQKAAAESPLAGVDIRSGRPDILAVMQEARTKCKVDMAIVNSGTPQVSDVCRMSVVKLLKEDGPAVEYYAEDTPW